MSDLIELICFIGLIVLVILWIIASRYGKHGCFNPNRRPRRIRWCKCGDEILIKGDLCEVCLFMEKCGDGG